MRILRNKANRKTLSFFRMNYKVYPPYRVLIDGNFVVHAERLKMEWQRLIPKLLQVEADQCHFHITECVMSELASLGAEFSAAVSVAKTLPLLKCRKKHGHSHDMDASGCFQALVGSDNAGKWVVITQDADLRTALRAVPGTPLALISNNVLVLEPPSAGSKEAKAAAEAGRVLLSKEEAKAVRVANAQLRQEGVASAVAAPRTDVVGTLQPKWKHHAAGPNPLSMQKKKRRPEDRPHDGGGDDSSTVHRKRRRKQGPGAAAGGGHGNGEGDDS